MAAAAFCTYIGTQSAQLDTPYGSGAFTMHQKVYYGRWYAGTYPTDWAYAYLNYKTEVWWTRTNTSYNLSSQSNNWFFNARNCDNIFDPHSTSGGGWLPEWYDANSTWIYIYEGPMNYWPILWAPLCTGCGIMYVSQSTDVTYNGSYVARLDHTYTFQKN